MQKKNFSFVKKSWSSLILPNIRLQENLLIKKWKQDSQVQISFKKNFLEHFFFEKGKKNEIGLA